MSLKGGTVINFTTTQSPEIPPGEENYQVITKRFKTVTEWI